MSKKGFTLIELLAVILILGIIALIAIPTVNNILDESRNGAFKASGDSVLKATQSKCQTKQIKNMSPNLVYTFSDRGISDEIDIKGTLPNGGYIILNNDCEIKSFRLTDGRYVYESENSTDFENQMLDVYGQIQKEYDGTPYMSSVSLFNYLYPTYYEKFKAAYFVKHLNIPDNAIEIKDPSITKNGKIKSWLIPNGDGYDLYVGSEDKIYMNYDSSLLFYSFPGTTLDLSNLYSDYSTSFYSLFNYAKMTSLDIRHFNTSNVKNFFAVFDSTDLTSIDLSNFDTSNATTMYKMFCWSDQLTNLDLSNFDTSNVTDMGNMFSFTRSLQSLDLSNFNTSKVVNMRGIFSGTNMKRLDLTNFNTSNVENLEYAFGSTTYYKSNLEYLDISTWDTSKVTTMETMFSFQTNLQEVKVGPKWSTEGVNVNNMFNGVNKGSSVIVKIG